MNRQEKRIILREIFIRDKGVFVDDKTLNHLVESIDNAIFNLSPTNTRLDILKDRVGEIEREIKSIEEGSKVS
jgi:hypothetical protein|tara:strand:+ start:628 stop:846 length:219 start_codon:yes stop_codon:yes gene_type:complete